MIVFLLIISFVPALDAAMQMGRCFNFLQCDENKQVVLSLSRHGAYPGDTVSMTCQGSKATGHPANLSISVNDVTLRSLVRGDNKSIEAKWTIKNTTRKIDVFCKDNTNQDWGCQDCNLLNVWEKPEPVANFTCKVVDWTESMVCKWDLGRSYRNPPNVTLQWRISNYGCAWNPCPHLDEENSLCRWQSTKTGDFTTKSLDLVITVATEGNFTSRSNYVINTKNFIQPKPVDNLRSETINSTCVKLSWTPIRKEYTKLYRILYHRKGEPETVHTIMLEDTQSTKAKNKTALICHLIPYSEYQFVVQSKPTWSDQDDTTCHQSTCPDEVWENMTCLTGKGYWSKEQTSETKTYAAAPGKAPTVYIGSYRWDPDDCSDGKKYREVCIYWQPVNPAFIYGVLRKYEVFITKEDTETQEEKMTVPPSLTNKCVTVECGYSYSVRVTAINQVGSSSPSNAIHITSMKTGITPPKFIVEMSNTTSSTGEREVQVTWSNNTCPTQCTYTIYTCKKDGGKCAFDDYLQWQNISEHLSSFEFSLASPDIYLYGVSVNTRQTSSGFIWNSCVYQRDIAPSKPPDNVLVQPTAGGLLVSWDKQLCQPQQPYINSYLIQYCTDANNTDAQCKYKTVSSSESSVELTNLEEAMTYFIRLCSVAGQQGPWTDYIQGNTTSTSKTSDGNATLIVIIVVCVCLVVILVASLVVLLFIKNQRLRQKFKEWRYGPPISSTIMDGLTAESNMNIPSLGRLDRNVGHINTCLQDEPVNQNNDPDAVSSPDHYVPVEDVSIEESSKRLAVSASGEIDEESSVTGAVGGRSASITDYTVANIPGRSNSSERHITSSSDSIRGKQSDGSPSNDLNRKQKAVISTVSLGQCKKDVHANESHWHVHSSCTKNTMLFESSDGYVRYRGENGENTLSNVISIDEKDQIDYTSYLDENNEDNINITDPNGEYIIPQCLSYRQGGGENPNIKIEVINEELTCYGNARNPDGNGECSQDKCIQIICGDIENTQDDYATDKRENILVRNMSESAKSIGNGYISNMCETDVIDNENWFAKDPLLCVEIMDKPTMSCDTVGLIEPLSEKDSKLQTVTSSEDTKNPCPQYVALGSGNPDFVGQTFINSENTTDNNVSKKDIQNTLTHRLCPKLEADGSGNSNYVSQTFMNSEITTDNNVSKNDMQKTYIHRPCPKLNVRGSGNSDYVSQTFMNSAITTDDNVSKNDMQKNTSTHRLLPNVKADGSGTSDYVSQAFMNSTMTADNNVSKNDIQNTLTHSLCPQVEADGPGTSDYVSQTLKNSAITTDNNVSKNDILNTMTHSLCPNVEVDWSGTSDYVSQTLKNSAIITDNNISKIDIQKTYTHRPCPKSNANGSGNVGYVSQTFINIDMNTDNNVSNNEITKKINEEIITEDSVENDFVSVINNTFSKQSEDNNNADGAQALVVIVESKVIGDRINDIEESIADTHAENSITSSSESIVSSDNGYISYDQINNCENEFHLHLQHLCTEPDSPISPTPIKRSITPDQYISSEHDNLENKCLSRAESYKVDAGGYLPHCHFGIQSNNRERE